MQKFAKNYPISGDNWWFTTDLRAAAVDTCFIHRLNYPLCSSCETETRGYMCIQYGYVEWKDFAHLFGKNVDRVYMHTSLLIIVPSIYFLE